MKPEDKSKRQTVRRHRTYKTKDDFLRWLRKQEAIKKRVQENPSNQAEQSISQALMVWADDGGAVIKSTITLALEVVDQASESC